MIGLPRAVAVFAHRTPVDMRKSFDALSAVVVSAMPRDLLSGSLFVFVGRDRRRAKVLYFDGTGLCVLAKRLSKGRFADLWSADAGAPLTLTSSELALFLEGCSVVGRMPLSPSALDPSSDLKIHPSSFKS